jgi:glycerophosphoryl diester phosphodiesterase
LANPLTIAHRGGAGLWPENTLPAFAAAARAGYDGAELDVQLTKDGVLAVTHDFRLNVDITRDESGNWLQGPQPLIRALAFEQLQSFDVGRARPGSSYIRNHSKLAAHDGAHIPSLGEVIDAVREAPGFRLLVELKASTGDLALSASAEEMAEAAVALLRKEKFEGRAVLVGFAWQGLIRARKLAPDIACWFSTTSGQFRQPGESGDNVAKIIRDAGGQGWFPHFSDATPASVRAAREAGIAIAAWTVNEPADIARMQALGLDAICSDFPNRLSPN